MGQSARAEGEWKRFKARYKKENARLLELLAAMSHTTDFSVGCYCEDEDRCHRSVVLLRDKGAQPKE